MKLPVVIIVLLIGAFAAADFASLTYVVSNHQRWPDIPGVILLALVFAQTLLLAAWFVFAGWNIALRLLIVIPVAMGLSRVAAGATEAGNDAVAPWFAVQLVAFCSVAAPLAIAKCFRVQVGLAGHRRPVARMAVWQFSIWGLLSGTTAVAIALGTARQVNMSFLDVKEAVAFFSCLAGTGLLVYFAAMGIKVPEIAAMVTIPVVGVVCPFCGLLMAASGLPPNPEPQQWMLFGSCYGATIALAVMATRVAGYRLSRNVPRPDAPVESISEKIEVE